MFSSTRPMFQNQFKYITNHSQSRNKYVKISRNTSYPSSLETEVTFQCVSVYQMAFGRLHGFGFENANLPDWHLCVTGRVAASNQRCSSPTSTVSADDAPAAADPQPWAQRLFQRAWGRHKERDASPWNCQDLQDPEGRGWWRIQEKVGQTLGGITDWQQIPVQLLPQSPHTAVSVFLWLSGPHKWESTSVMATNLMSLQGNDSDTENRFP